jgi:predicted CoA-binding protein
MPSRAAIDEFLACDRLAVVGVSRDQKAFANQVYRHLRDQGRHMTPVHRQAHALEGDRCVPSVLELSDEVQGVLVMVNADDALGVVDDCIERGIRRVWLHRGAGPGAVSEEAVRRCREAGVLVVDGACPLMFAEPVGLIHRFHRMISGRKIAQPA